MSDRMTVTIAGEVTRIKEQQTFASGFTKQAIFVKQVEGKYPQTFEVEFVKDRIALIDGVNVGDRISALCDIRSNKPDGYDRCFASFACWKVVHDEGAPAGEEYAQPEPAQEVPTLPPQPEGEDLPF